MTNGIVFLRIGFLIIALWFAVTAGLVVASYLVSAMGHSALSDRLMRYAYVMVVPVSYTLLALIFVGAVGSLILIIYLLLITT